MKTPLNELIQRLEVGKEKWDNDPIYNRVFSIAINEAKALLLTEIEQISDAYGDGLNAHRTDFCNRDQYFSKKYLTAALKLKQNGK